MPKKASPRCVFCHKTSTTCTLIESPIVFEGAHQCARCKKSKRLESLSRFMGEAGLVVSDDPKVANFPAGVKVFIAKPRGA